MAENELTRAETRPDEDIHNINTARNANAGTNQSSAIAVVGFEDSEEATKDIYKRAVAEFAFVMANIASA